MPSPPMAKLTRQYVCSFCGKSHREVRKMIAGPNGVYICNVCVIAGQIILDRELRAAPVVKHPVVKLECK